jgi:hypothetical protein
VKYFTFSFWKKVWFAISGYLRPRNSEVLFILKESGINIDLSYCPDILGYIELQSYIPSFIQNYGANNIPILAPDYSRFKDTVDGLSLEKVVNLDVDLKSDIIPLVFKFSDPDGVKHVHITYLYAKPYNFYCVVVYCPHINLLAIMYANGKNLLLGVEVNTLKCKEKVQIVSNKLVYRGNFIDLSQIIGANKTISFFRPFQNS